MTPDTIEAKIARMEANHENLVQIINKLDATLTKITEVSTDIAQMLAVHENRINQQERATKDLIVGSKHDFEKVDNEIGRLYQRVDNVRDEIHRDLESGFARLESQFGEAKVDLNNYRDRMDTRYKKIEKFIWMMAGGGVVVGFIMSKGITVLLTYFVK